MARRRTVVSIPILLALSTLPLALTASADVGPTALVIAVDTEFADAGFTFTVPIHVLPGATLTFRNAQVFLDAPPVCSPLGGSLAYCHGDITVTDATVRFIDSEVDTHAQVHGDDFRDMWRIIGLNSAMIAEGTSFHHGDLISFQGAADQRSSFVRNVFEGGKTGPILIRGAEADFIDNTFQNQYFGIRATDGHHVIRGNTFLNIVNSAVNFEDTLVGDKPYPLSGVVEDNVFDGGGVGLILLTTEAIPVTGNAFRNLEAGVKLGLVTGEGMSLGGVPTFTDNLVQGNIAGVEVYTSALSSRMRYSIDFSMSGNSLVDNCMDLTSNPRAPNVELQVDARGNWWGTAAGPVNTPGCPAVAGPNVTTSPWLTAAP